MIKVSVCLILDKPHYQTLYYFERLGFSKHELIKEIIIPNEPKEYVNKIYGVEVELIVGYTKATPPQTIDYFKPLSNLMVNIDGLNKYEAYNKLFLEATLDLVCVYSLDAILQKDWLLELVFYSQAVNKSGIVSICSEVNGLNCYSLIDKEQEIFHNVYMPKSETLDNESVYVFDKQNLYLIGGFDTENKLYGQEFNQLQLRYKYNYFNNYYIPSQSCIVFNNGENVTKNEHSIGSQNLKESIEFMKKNRSFYVPLKQNKE